MQTVPMPKDELGRIRALRELGALDSGREAAYDDLTELAAHICGTPISLITLVDAERQWFKSRVGIDLDETSRDVSFCAHAIVDGGLLEVEDALQDERFSANPLVLDDPNIRFYAGAPLTTTDGYSLGTLCVIDRVPRKLTDAQSQALTALSRAVIAQLELGRRNRMLHELEQAREEFMGLVAHELRTPLSSIIGYVDELRSGSVGDLDETQQRFLEVVARNANRLESLVDDLLFLAQAEVGKAPIEHVPVDLGVVASHSVEAARFASGEKQIALALHDDGDAVVEGDARRLGQAIDNLLSNAIKFTAEGGAVTVSVAADGGESVVTVADTGMGIAPDDLSRVFGRFYRTSGATSAAIPGAGLGLGITRAIVEAHAGTVDVESEVGRGTTFRIRLPARSA